jgi:hypothetical protein
MKILYEKTSSFLIIKIFEMILNYLRYYNLIALYEVMIQKLFLWQISVANLEFKQIFYII